jgi:hypothetical protein
MLIVGGVRRIIIGDGGYAWGLPLIDWIGWVLLPAGIIISIMSIRSLLRGPIKYTDADFSLFIGIVMLILGVRSIIITGEDGDMWGNTLAGWIGGAMLPAGIIISIMSIQALLRGPRKNIDYTDEELARAKEALDRMYFEEHGSWPKTDRKKDGS